MSSISLHIGVPKTATSYIQSWLHVNRARLKERGVHVPEQPINAHRLAVEHLTGPPWDTRPDIPEIRKVSLESARQSFMATVRSSASSRTIISSEYFYYAPPDRVADAMKQDFGADVAVDVVVYIRSQGSLVLSGHNQDIKRLGKTASRPKPAYHRLYDWGILLDRWSAAFGKPHVKAISYDASVARQTILADFVAAACPALSRPLADGFFQDVAIQNESLPADLLEFKRLTNSLDEPRPGHQWLEQLLRTGYQGPKFGVSAEEINAWRSAYAQANEYTAREYFNGATVDQLFPLDTQKAAGVDLEGRLTPDTISKLAAFAIRQGGNGQTTAQLSSLEARLANLTTAKSGPPDGS